MLLRGRAYFLCIFLVACATTSGAGKGSEDPPLTPNEVRVRVWVSTQQEPTPYRVESGGLLNSGDKFRMELRAAKPVFVYAFRAVSQSGPTQFYPATGQAAKPASMLMMPGEEDFYTLGETVGGEDLRIVALAA